MTVQENMDILWIIIAAGMVFLMQAGFAALESGLTRAKNTINVALKNVTDFTVATMVFWFCGYVLMFGESIGGYIGHGPFMVSDADEPYDYALFLFQATFAGTAATIVSGAVAERIRFISYAIITVVVTAIIYPVSGHWIWGGGWLAEMGMVDFAGSTVVHSLGAWVGLAGAWVLGPRLGRFSEDGRTVRMPGHNQVMAVIGVLILWFGWFGFNGGSTLTADGSIAKIVANTTLAGASGGVMCFVLSLIMAREVHIARLLNGIIGGLVGITAGCAVVNMDGAVLIGLSSGAVAYFFEWLLVFAFKIDDPVNVVAAHGASGAWGTLLLAFVAPVSALPLESSLSQFWVQLQGVVSVFVWGFGSGCIVFYVLKQFNLLRVPLDAERLGLNIYEHGATTGLMEISDAMREILPPNQGGKGDLTARVHVEMGTEAGDIAMLFNKLVGSYHDTVLDLNMTMQTLQKSISGVRIASHDMQSNMSGQTASTSKVSDTVATMLGAVSNVSRHTTEAEEAALTIKESTSESSKTVHEVISCVDTLATEVAEAGEVIKSLREDIRGIGSISELIRGVSEQTNLLALNAAIEAARAGEHGRGFAVVADEVRGLASRVADSTEEIGKLVKNVESRAEQAVGVIERGSTSASHSASIAGQASEALDRIQENINEIAKRTSQIKDTVQDHEEVATAVNDQIVIISGSTNQVDALATSTADSSDTLSKVSEGLRQSVAHFVVSASHSASELIHAPAKMEEVDASLPEFNDIKTD